MSGSSPRPASYPECLAVAATNVDDQPWSGSSRGAQVDISAPGQAVWTAATNQGPNGPAYSVEQGDGTSFAVAGLAGVAALWLAHHGADAIKAKYGGATQEVFRLLVTLTCRVPTGWDGSRYGAGIVDAAALLKAPLPDPPGLALAAGDDDAEDVVEPNQGPMAQLAATWSDRSIAEIERSLSARFGGLAATADDGSDRQVRQRDPLPGRRGPAAAPGAGAADDRGAGRRRPFGGRRGGQPGAVRGLPWPRRGTRALRRAENVCTSHGKMAVDDHRTERTHPAVPGRAHRRRQPRRVGARRAGAGMDRQGGLRPGRGLERSLLRHRLRRQHPVRPADRGRATWSRCMPG